jgi:hypothetical protein
MRRREERSFVNRLKSADVLSLESLVEAIYWILVTGAGGLLPLWGGYIVLRAFSQSASLTMFAKSGEFVVFGAGILSSTIFEVTKEITPNIAEYFREGRAAARISDSLRLTFPYHRAFSIISLVLILMAAIVFSVVTVARIPGMDAPLNTVFVSNLSLFVFFCAMVIGVLVTAFSNVWMSQRDLQESRQDELIQLRHDFEALGDD